MHASWMPRAAAALFAILALGGGASPLQAEEAATLDLSQARVLASPGWPAALEGFLPPGRTVEPLAMPLPKGPVLVLGLWSTDPAAREVGAALGLVPSGDLGGGYTMDVALVDGQPRAVILAQDGAALAAARFELETFTPEAHSGTPRSLDMTKPDEQGGVRSAVGRRSARAGYRIRGLGGPDGDDSPLEVAAAHANRLWLTRAHHGPDKPPMEGRPASFALLAEHGIGPVALGEIQSLRSVGWSPDDKIDVSDRTRSSPIDTVQREAGDAQSAIDELLAWQAKGVRHFALKLANYHPPERELQRQINALIVRRAIHALRPGGLKELLVIPHRGSAPATWPDMSGIPEVLVGWYGPTGRDLVITREQAARVVCEARVPVVLIETWMQASSYALPSFPRGRDKDLGEVLAGIVVLPGPAATEALVTAWAPGAPEPSPHPAIEELLACCAADPADPEAFLRTTATNLAQALEGRFADPWWLREIPDRMRGFADSLPGPGSRIVARTVEQAPVLDGVLEPAWEQALVTQVGPAEVRALTDGRTLTLGVRVPTSSGATSIAVYLTAFSIKATVNLDAARENLAPAALAPHAARLVGQAWEFEVAYDHYALNGDPYPGRIFHAQVEIQTPTEVFRLAPDPVRSDRLKWMKTDGRGQVIVVR